MLLASLPALILALSPVTGLSDTDWGAANAAYREGLAEPRRTMPDAQLLLCDALWSKWMGAVADERIPADVLGQLHPDLGQNALTWSLQWNRKADTVPDKSYSQLPYDQAGQALDAILDGKAASMPRYFGTMGACKANL